jgi:hypothetical protein
MSSIRNSNLLYRPSLSIWTARKLDKAESVKVNKENGAVAGAANVHKQLLPDSSELLSVQKWANSFRTFIYTSTLPWDDSGWRIGRVARHMEFMAEIGDRIVEGNLLVDAFVWAYNIEVGKAKTTLGHMFSYDDYPGEQEVRSKFRFAVDVMPMPSAEDFRVVDGVEKAEVDRLVKIATASTEARIQEAMKEAYQRLYTVVAKMANTLEQYGAGTVKKFNDSLVENIAEIVGVMPALNLTGDPKLTALADEAKQLAQYSLVDLRKNDTVRDAAILDARKLASRFRGLVDASINTPVSTPVHTPAAPRPVETPAKVVVPIASAPSKRALFADML